MVEMLGPDVADLALMAGLFDYPGPDFVARVDRAAMALNGPCAAQHLRAFAAEVRAMKLELLEEAHVRTFLVAPASAPYVGVHLFGEESFKRAYLMARFVERFRALDFDPGNELPDHLGVLLRFAGRLESEELGDLVRWCLVMPVTAMRDSLCATRNPYRHLLAGLAESIAPDGLPEAVAASITRVAQAADPEGCSGCSIRLGGDEL